VWYLVTGGVAPLKQNQKKKKLKNPLGTGEKLRGKRGLLGPTKKGKGGLKISATNIVFRQGEKNLGDPLSVL